MRTIRKILFIICTFICVVMTVSHIGKNVPEVINNVSLLNEVSPSFYVEDTINTGYTNINGISNIYLNLQQDGWKVHKVIIEDTFIDISMTKYPDLSCRVYFKVSDGWTALFLSEYENSNSLLAYISDEGRK